ncbi:MAG: hypothetical protein Q8O10_00005 [candidate division Zixibacteria bacterium]|nr:hypothetical protein [candidate division Zixibacteria bacterium]
MKSKYFLIVAGLMLVLFSYSSAQVPQLINYQGKLTKSNGAPLDTTISMVFSIYADSAGTILKWTETQGAVKVEKGLFNVLLGSVDSIPYSVFDGSIRYLGVKVGTDPEITPRKPMVSVPYAYKSFEADTADYAKVATSDGDWTIDGDNIYRLQGNVGIGTSDPESYKLKVNGSSRITGNLSLTYVLMNCCLLTGLAPGNYRDILIETVLGGGAFYIPSTYNSWYSNITKLRCSIWAESSNNSPGYYNTYYVRVENIGANVCTDYDWIQVIKMLGAN